MSFSEKYQVTIEKINERIPIKWLTKPIDKLFPTASLFLFIAIILVILFLIFKPFSSNLTEETSVYTIAIADNTNKLLTNFEFEIKNLNSNSTQSYRTDSKGIFTIELNKYGDYALIINKKGYKYKEEVLDLSKSRLNFIVDVFEIASKQNKSLQFIRPDGQLVSEKLNVTITCQDGTQVVVPSTTNVENGKGTFELPLMCNRLVATAIGNTYSATNVIINPETGIIQLQEKAIIAEYGQVRVTVKSGANPLDGITLRIYKVEDTINPVTSGQSQFGARRFSNIETGEYIVTATDDSSRYQTKSANFIVTKNVESQVSLELDAINEVVNPGDSIVSIVTRDIKVILKDSETNQEISVEYMPNVLLILDANQTVDTKAYTQTGIMLRIEDGKNYSLTAKAEGYIPQVRNITPNVNEYSIFLEKITVSNVSDINISVKDEDNLPIVGATLWLYDGNLGYIDTRFTPLLTDVNGQASFENIPTGYYFVKLRKTNVVGESNKFTHTPPTDSNVSILINIGQGTINLNIKNINNETIDFADIRLYNITGEEIGLDQANQSGIYNKKIKADKIVYAKISKTGYYDYFTELMPVIKNETLNKEIKLYRSGYATTPTAELIGLYNISEQSTENFTQNARFNFKFRLITPNPGNLGIRFLIGEKNNITEDIVLIKPILNSIANTAYYSDTLPTRVLQDSPTKMTDTMFSNVQAGVYELTIPVQTLAATRGAAIPIYYSIYTGVAPEPNTLGNQKIYYIDVSELCSEDFCIKGQFVDTEDGIAYDLDETNNGLIVNKTYQFNYEITNAKSNVFYNNRLTIKNIENTTEIPTQAINFLNYTISGAGFSSSSSSGEQTRNSIPFYGDYLDSQTINVYDKIYVNTTIKPVLLGGTRIQNKIISGQLVAYNKMIEITASQQFPFTITYEPQNIVPNKAFTLKVIAMDNSNQPITNAIVNIYQKKGNNQLIALNVGQQRTNDIGVASINLPPLKNAEKIIISVEKSGYYSAPVEIIINQDILSLKQDGSEVKPASPFILNINKSNPQGTEKRLTIINKTDYPLTLKEFTDDGFSFSNSNYLNIEQLKNYLNSQVGNIVVPANGEADIKLKLAASQDAENLVETLNLVGTITGNVSVGESQTTYPFEIPMNVKLSVGEGVEEDDCLVVNGVSNPWQSIVSGNSAVIQTFTITNNCRVKGNSEESINLKNIRAKIVNDKDMYGNYILTVDGKSITLSEGAYTTIFNDLSPGPHAAIIEYRALDKKFGDVKTKIYINGQVETNDGLKYVNTSKEIAFTTDIAIRKIQDCIDFYDGSKKINNMFVIPKETFVGEVQELNVKNNCSDLGRFKLEFCEGKKWYGCQEVRYDNMEGLLQNEINFNRGDTTQVVGIIKPEVPGAYIIPVKISVLGDTGRAIVNIEKRLKVNVHSSSGLYMEDPFIEMEKTQNEIGTEIYSSQTVRLLNSDINVTPWDYAVQKVEGDTGFSKFMVTSEERPYFEKMLFSLPNELTNQTDDGAEWWNTASTVAASLATTAIIGGALAAGTSSLTMAMVFGSVAGTYAGGAFLGPLYTVLAAIGPWGWAAIGVIAIGGWMASTWHNDYEFDPYYEMLDVSSVYTMPDFETTKEIKIISDGDQEEFVNVFDITGARYFTYLKLVGKTHGKTNKLTSDEMLDTEMPKCGGKQHQEFFDEYKRIVKNENCNDEFDKYEVTEDQIIAGVQCYGSKPTRNKINLEFEVYTSCKYDKAIWPEQAGIKPIDFVVDYSIDGNSTYQKLLRGDIVYKNITFKPTLNDNNGSQDKAFVGSQPIGDFRFAFISKQYPDSPQVDQNMVDCFTDSGKVGKTGEGAVPKVNLDWTWKTTGFDTNVCSTGNQYCDATQLSQVIIERMKKVEDQLENKEIICPRSTGQVLDQALSGSYNLTSSVPNLDNEIPAGYIGLQNVSARTDGNLVKIGVVIENRTGSLKTGTLNLKLGNQILKSYTELLPNDNCTTERQHTEGTMIGINTINPILNTTVPACENENTAEYWFTYGEQANPLIGNNIKLEVEYSGANTYLEDPNQTYYTTDINLSVHQAQPTGGPCQVPITTAQFNGVDYIDMWFNKEQYPNNVISEWNIEDIQQLKQTIEFDAYLITDNYNKQFQTDFDKAYGGKMSAGQSSTYAFLGAPSYYQNGIYSKLFRDNTEFNLKYTNNQSGVNILVPGKYKVRIDFIFGNEHWDFIRADDLDVNATVTLTYISGPESDSIFYRMPFNGAVGLTNNGYSRQNYGLAYMGDEITISKQGELPLTTKYSSSSNPKKYLNVQYNKDFFKINSNVETRGNILTIKEQTEDQIQLIYSPNYPNATLMSVTRTNLMPFSAYYQITDPSNQPLYGGTSLGVWNGVGDSNYYDFSGEYVYSRFINFYDRQTTPDERMYNSYAIDWDTVARKGIVNLRTIFYVPYDSHNSIYKLTSKSRGDVIVKFNKDNKNPNDSYTKNLLSNGENYNTDNLTNIFEKVRTNQICVVNSDSGKTTEFYWNPKVIYGNNNIYTGIGITGIN